MPDDWSSTIVAKMHSKHITGKKLAELTGYTPQYISQVLNGHKDTNQARAKIEDALKNVNYGRVNNADRQKPGENIR